MNKLALNIAVLVFLSGCSHWYTKPDGERINKNAPVFVSAPNTNKGIVNKPADKPISPSIVSFQAEKYIMVKESELNVLVEDRVKNRLKAPNTNAPIANKNEVNKEEVKVGEISPIVLETVKIQQEDKSFPIMKWFFSCLTVFLFVCGVGFLLYRKNFKIGEDETQSPGYPVIPKDPPSATQNPPTETTPPAAN